MGLGQNRSRILVSSAITASIEVGRRRDTSFAASWLPVRFSEAIRAAWTRGRQIRLEAGQHDGCAMLSYQRCLIGKDARSQLVAKIGVDARESFGDTPEHIARLFLVLNHLDEERSGEGLSRAVRSNHEVAGRMPRQEPGTQ